MQLTARSLVVALSLVAVVDGAPATLSAQVTGGFTVSQQGLPPRDQPAPATGTARITGRVIDGMLGTPLRRAVVRITAPELRGMRTTTTDADGRYEMSDLPGGRYSVSASKNGFVDSSYGQRAPLESGKQIQLADRQRLENIDIALPRGSVITGRVIDEFGEPMSDVQVMGMRMQFTPNGRRPAPAGRSNPTNDIGEFRLYGLAPGQYFISATHRALMFAGPNGQGSSSEDRTGYAPSYYPGTPNIAEAQPVTVGVGETVPDVTIMLSPARTARLSGVVIDSEGKAIAQGSVMAMQATGFMVNSTAGGQIRPDGTFVISGVVPGRYTLQATSPRIGQSPGPPAFSVATVDVSGADISGIRLEPLQPVTLSGRLIVDPAVASSLRPQSVRIGATPTAPDAGPMMRPQGPPEAVRDDLTFSLRSVPGSIVVRPALPPGWMVRAVRLNGSDVTAGFTLRGDEQGELEVELSNRAPTLSGQVTNRRGEIVTDYTAIAFPQDHARWSSPPPGAAGISRPDQDGRFTLRTLVPGEYFIVAVEQVQNGQWWDPEYLERVSADATRLTLAEGDSKTIDLKLLDQVR